MGTLQRQCLLKQRNPLEVDTNGYTPDNTHTIPIQRKPSVGPHITPESIISGESSTITAILRYHVFHVLLACLRSNTYHLTHLKLSVYHACTT